MTRQAYRWTVLITRYKNVIKPQGNSWRSYAAAQPVLASALRVAALARNKQWHLNPHQRRIGNARLVKWADFLAVRLKKLMKVTDFDCLLRAIAEKKPKNIGELTIYDTAAAFGRRIGKIPKCIYVHAGTRKGLNQILPNFRGRSIYQSELPPIFASCNLSAEELEHFFCVFHKALNPRLSDSAFQRAVKKVVGLE